MSLDFLANLRSPSLTSLTDLPVGASGTTGLSLPSEAPQMQPGNSVLYIEALYFILKKNVLLKMSVETTPTLLMVIFPHFRQM